MARKKMSEDEIYKEAERRVKAKKDFYIHLTVYVCVNAFLIVIWALPGGRGFPWFVFVLGGWGIGLVVHFLDTFFFGKKTGGDAVEKEADKIRKSQR